MTANTETSIPSRYSSIRTFLLASPNFLLTIDKIKGIGNKTIQLFFNSDNESKFREAVNKISKENNIDNISDAVLKAVLNESNKT